jgi:group I intron endonuclease
MLFSALSACEIFYMPITIRIDLLGDFYNSISILSLIPFSTLPNFDSNPYINQIKTKIKSFLSNNSVKDDLSSYIIERIDRDSSELVKELNLSKYLDENQDRIFTAPLPIGFTSLLPFNDQPGVYLFKSKNNLCSYIGSTMNLYIRCKNHYNNSINNKKKHPKLYNYVGKYNWDSMEIQVLALNINHEKQFMLNFPSFEFNREDIDLLFLLSKYELLLTEQYFIDHLNPNLNVDFIVNWGGQPNKGSTGYTFSEEERELRSIKLRGREYSEFTKDLHKTNMTGTKLSKDTRKKMQDSYGGVAILSTQMDNGNQITYSTKSAAALALKCSIRTVYRRCEDNAVYRFKGNSYKLSYKNI